MEHLLLLHGALGEKGQVRFISDLLEKEPTSSISFYGHGNETGSEPAEDFSIQKFGQQVVNWLDTNRIGRTDIFGYSMGGYVALWLKRNYPDRIDKVMTLATKFNWTPETAKAEVKFLDAQRIEEKVPAYAKKLAATHGEGNWRTLLNKTAKLLTSLGDNPPLTDLELGQVTGKVLIAVGDKDGMVSIEESLNASRWVPEAQFLVIPGCVHPIDKVNPEMLGFHIREFFKAN